MGAYISVKRASASALPKYQYLRATGGSSVVAPSLTTTSISPTTATQWDAQTSMTVNGTGFTNSSVASLGGVALATTYVSQTQLTCVIPAAETASSPLQTAGAANVTVSNGGAPSNGQAFTIGAWTMASIAGLLEWNRADAANMTLNVGQISAWADNMGNGNTLGQGSGLSQPVFDALEGSLNNQGAAEFNIAPGPQFVTGPIGSAVASVSQYTVFAAFTVVAAPVNAATIYNNAAVFADVSGYWGMYIKGTGSNTIVAHNFDTADEVCSVPFTVGVPNVITQRHGSGTLAIRSGLGTESTVASGNTGSLASSIRVGKNLTTVTAQMELAEFAIANVNVPSIDRDRAARYMKVRYAA